MKKFTFFLAMLISTFAFSQTFPIDFESGTYEFTDFDGGAVTIIDNPQISGINTSAMVAQMVKNDGQVWGGSFLSLGGTIDFSENQVFTMKVYSPRADCPVLFKLEGDNGEATELSVNTTVANEWELLSYDFNGAASDVYTKIVFIFDLGVMGDGTDNFTFLFDDIEFIPSENPALTLPVDFESGPYGFVDFDGATATVIDNPHSSDANNSATVAQIGRNGGRIWAGSKLILNNNIDFSTNNAFSMKVYSTRTDIPVLFKLESASGAQTEVSVNTSVANEWETMTWDFAGTASDTYNTLVFMFDFGAVGDGTENSTFLFDDIEQIDLTGGLSQIDLPVTFEETDVDYTVTDFGNNATVLGADPTDTSNTVAITTKNTGAETWAGTTIGTANGFASVIPFTETETSISVKVYSPSAGIQIRLKAEDHNNVTLTAETEKTTTLANEWETLVFDLSDVADGTNPFNLSTNFDKVSIFFDFGNTGAGDVYYWDDVEFGGEILASDATLSDLLVDGNTITGFSSSTLDYTFALPIGSTEVPTVTAISNHDEASVEITATTELPGTTSILVTSADATETLTYTISFTLEDIMDLPIDFESGTYDFINFDGGSVTVIDNPQITDENNSATVAQMVRDGGQMWAGSYLVLSNPLDFSVNNFFSMKVFSTRADVPVLFKLEGDDGIATEITVNTTVANEWETLTWDFTGTESGIYYKLVFIFDFGTVGDGSENSTFLFDDIDQNNGTSIQFQEMENIEVFAYNGLLTINTGKDLLNGKIDIYDISGRKIISKTITSSNEQINIETDEMLIVLISDKTNMPVAVKKIIAN